MHLKRFVVRLMMVFTPMSLHQRQSQTHTILYNFQRTTSRYTHSPKTYIQNTQTYNSPTNHPPRDDAPNNPTRYDHIPGNPSKDDHIPDNPSKDHYIPDNPSKDDHIPDNPSRDDHIPGNTRDDHSNNSPRGDCTSNPPRDIHVTNYPPRDNSTTNRPTTDDHTTDSKPFEDRKSNNSKRNKRKINNSTRESHTANNSSKKEHPRQSPIGNKPSTFRNSLPFAQDKSLLETHTTPTLGKGLARAFPFLTMHGKMNIKSKKKSAASSLRTAISTLCCLIGTANSTVRCLNDTINSMVRCLNGTANSKSTDHHNRKSLLVETAITADLPHQSRRRRGVPETTTYGRVMEQVRMTSATDGGGPPGVEVAIMISDLMAHNLPGCYKVVLYMAEEPYLGLVGAVVAGVGDGALLWQLDAFLAAIPPPYAVFTRTRYRSISSLCVAFIILADLQAVGRATKALQRGRWFQDASKKVFAYTGSSLPLATLAQHPFLGSAYGTVLASWWPWKDSALRNSRMYHLTSSCPYCRNGQPEVKLVDVWIPGTGSVWGNPLYPNTYKNFHGHTFNIVTLEYAPFICYDKLKNGYVRLRDCVDTRILNTMASHFNFTYRVREPHDQQWGYKLENSTYTGVIGAVARYEADFSLNVAYTGDREEAIDYTIGYFNDPLTFCTTKPRLLSHSLALIKPFQPMVWAGFLIVLVAMGLFYHAACIVAQPQKATHTSPSFSQSFLKIFGACLSQGCHWSTADGPRVLVLTWIIFSLVTLTSYVAMLTASFTLPTLSPTLNTLEQLVESDFSWGIQDQGAADYQLLKSSQVPLYQKVYKGLKVCPSLDECLIMARDTKYAFITWRLYMEDRIAIRFTSVTGERQLHVATSSFFPTDIGWAMNPGCPFRKTFSQQIRRLLEAGIISKWLSQIINDPIRRQAVDTKEKPRQEGQLQPLGLGQLQGVFYILSIGNAVAFLQFMREIFMHFP